MDENTHDPDREPDDLPARGPLGDVIPGRDEADPRTRGGQKPEKVEDRPTVGTVKPEDYPEQQ
jgi:hypothetical protein